MCSASVRTAIIALMMDTVRTSETSVYFNGATRRYIPQDYHIHTRRPENLKFLIILFHFIFWEGVTSTQVLFALISSETLNFLTVVMFVIIGLEKNVTYII
jgi:hypothetical protein